MQEQGMPPTNQGKHPATVTDAVYMDLANSTPVNVINDVYDPSATNPETVTSNTYHPELLPDQDRAIWIWENASYPLVLNPNSRAALSSMAKDTTTFNQRPITTLYLAVGQYNGAKCWRIIEVRFNNSSSGLMNKVSMFKR